MFSLKDLFKKNVPVEEKKAEEILFPFDTAEQDGALKAGIPVHIQDPENGIDMSLSVCLSGSFRCSVADPAVYGNYADDDRFGKIITTDLWSAFLPAMMTVAGTVRQPFEITEHAQGILQSMQERNGEIWKEKYGIALEEVRLDRAEPDEKSRGFYDQMLRMAEMKRELLKKNS